LIYNGVDGVEIYSELHSESKKELIQKIRNITKETNQHIPILYNLSYFRTLIQSIISVDKSDPSANTLLDHKEISLSENQAIYIFKEKKHIEDFLEKNRNYNTNVVKNSSSGIVSSTSSNRIIISSSSLEPASADNVVIINSNNKATYIKEKSDKELLVNEENASSLNNVISTGNNNNNNNNNNNISNNPVVINSENNNQEAPFDLNEIENAKIELLQHNKNFIVLSTNPPLNFKSFDIADLIHINFGEVTFSVCEVNENYIRCKCLNSGKIELRNTFSVESKDHLLANLVTTDERKLYEELIEAANLKVDYIVISIICEPNKEIE